MLNYFLKNSASRVVSETSQHYKARSLDVILLMNNCIW